MPQAGSTKPEDSLFSLELVVEKVYIPHTPCRFPAIAFRLLDYPTIIIKHVEDDLGVAIRKKISFDPDYQLPDQFIELKDKHGNFMVKKGKSCLFRTGADILKQHLANTPMYVMVIDLFPEVPKLVGNSTVPLNSLMDSICIDIAKLGPTVPSVHGDKGLFKLYNLMGKEIGYFVLGFRLLCLGPSLIPHLPASALMQPSSKGKQTREAKKVDDMITKHENCAKEEDESEENNIELRNSACMTDPIKHDVLLQTVEVEDKVIHVAVGGIDRETETRPAPDKELQSISTQTERRRRIKEAQNIKQKWVEHLEHKIDDDEIIINNIICPPPLFYNSEAAPSIKIERQQKYQPGDEMSVEDLSDIESYDGFGLQKEKSVLSTKKVDSPNGFQRPNPISFQPKTEFSIPTHPVPQARVGERVQGLQVAPQADAVFPLLTALINELSCIQNPQLLLQVSNHMQAASNKIQRSGRAASESRVKQVAEDDKLSPSVVAAVAAALNKKAELSKENIVTQKEEKAPGPQDSSQVPTKTKKSSNADTSKTSPVRPSKKGKLVYGMTNTQRLRLQKTNPQWLKSVEKEVSDLKAKKHQQKPPDLYDVNATTFSDTLTEVRRLAERELNSTAGGDTLVNVASEVEMLESTVERKEHKQSPQKKPRSPSKENRNEGRRLMKDESPPRLTNQRSVRKTPSPKVRSKIRRRRALQQKEIQASSDSDELIQRKPVPLERHINGITSPSLMIHDLKAEDNDDQMSPRSDMPSSRSRSIEVRLPSAEPDLDDSATITDAEDNDKDDEEDFDIPLPDDSMQEKPKPQGVNLPRYFSRDSSLPDAIEGTANASVNLSDVIDDNSPLESTRQSKNLTSDQNDSRVLQSTDYDTRQFHSTDEPELQELVSEEENHSDGVNSGRRSVASVRTSQKFPVINPQLSENSPVPSVRRSTTKLDPAAQSILPSLSYSKGGGSPVSSRPATPKGDVSGSKDFKVQALNLKSGNLTASKTSITPRSASSSPRRPTPRPRRPLRESIHTDSLSSYMPSDPENVIVSLSSNSGNYSDDFQPLGSGESGEANSMVEQLPKIIPSTKLGYTIN